MTEQLLSAFPTTGERTAYMAQLAADHPYFTPAQFHCLQKATPGTENYKNLVAINALLFNNNRWLHFQLNQAYMATDSIRQAEPPADAPPPGTTPDNDTGGEVPVVAFPAPEDTTTAGTTTDTAIEAGGEVPVIAFPAPEDTTATGITTDPAIETERDNPADAITPSPETITGPQSAEEVVSMPEPILRLRKDDSSMLFEPYHAVDYFAALGIRLNEEAKPVDKLGVQLKSFTEWLKSMKKIHNQPGEAQINDATQQAIQHIAEKSNIQDEVVTEAMAEVYLQQGKAGKAIQVYEKLSLLNPSKSAFFAAKIENLKGT